MPVLSSTTLPDLASLPRIVTREIRISSDTAGVELLLRNKRQSGRRAFDDTGTLLYVHGASYPSSTTFDLPFDGVSMMDLFAACGWDVYCVDLRGYGGSTRPPEMAHPPETGEPLVRTEVAARDVTAAVDWILSDRGIESLDLLGFSWGTAIAGLYTTRHCDKVHRLVLYAPRWIDPTGGHSAIDSAGELGAYRTISIEAARARWLRDVPDDAVPALISESWFELWARTTWATDDWGARQTPALLRAPNGVIEDDRAYWQVGESLYDAGSITAPTLLLHGEWDADLPSRQSHALFAALTGARRKRFVEIGKATHNMMMERNRIQFFREVLLFLSEP